MDDSFEFQDWVGRKQVQRDVLTPSLLARFRATIDSAESGDTAPQAIHWCLCPPDAPTAALGADGHPRRSDSPDSFLPPIPLPRRMWASGKLAFLAPIPVGASITRTSTLASITPKTGSSGTLVFVEVDHDIRADDLLCVAERQTIVYRAATSAPPAPAPVEVEVDLSAWDWHSALRPGEPMLFRYSALTFNSHRIHYDRPYAVEEEKYRGLVVHGPLTASLLLDLAARQLGHNVLTRFSFRGESPAFSGEALHLVGRDEGGQITLAALGGDGRTIMSATAQRG